MDNPRQAAVTGLERAWLPGVRSWCWRGQLRRWLPRDGTRCFVVRRSLAHLLRGSAAGSSCPADDMRRGAVPDRRMHSYYACCHRVGTDGCWLARRDLMGSILAAFGASLANAAALQQALDTPRAGQGANLWRATVTRLAMTMEDYGEMNCGRGCQMPDDGDSQNGAQLSEKDVRRRRHTHGGDKLLCIFPVSLLRQSFLCAHKQIKLLMIFLVILVDELAPVRLAHVRHAQHPR